MTIQRYNEIFNDFVNYIDKNDRNIASMQNANSAWHDFKMFESDLTQEEEVGFVKVFGNDIRKLKRQFN